MPAIALIICTHNPRADYFTRVLAALQAQILPLDIWELLVIDNASKESVAPRFDIGWHPHGRNIREDELGLTHARLRGIGEANAELLVFVDDDNVLAPNYLEEALRIAIQYPYLGAWSVELIAEYDTPPPEWTKQIPHREFDQQGVVGVAIGSGVWYFRKNRTDFCRRDLRK